MSKTAILQLDYVAGHLRYGHFEYNIPDKDLEEFESLSKNEQIEWVLDEGELIIDDFEVDDFEHSGALRVTVDE